MAVQKIQTAFNAGELAPSVWGHVDFAKFALGCSTMRNFYVDWRGGARSRAGTSFVGYSKQTVLNTASGSIFFGANAVDGQTITLNGAVLTFRAAPATPYELAIGGNAGGTLFLAVTQLSTNGTLLADTRLNVATYAETGGIATDTLVITYKTQGPAGNSYTLAASTAAPSGPTLTGGGNNGPRIITFQFNLNQGLVLEFGELYMRVISQGAYVTETPKAITAITQGTPCTVTIAGHGYQTGDWDYLSDIGGMTPLNGHTYVITRINANQFSLADVFGTAIDSSGFPAYTTGGTAARIYTLVTPYHAVDLKFLKFTQSADVMSLTLRNQETGTEYAPYDLGRLADDNWTLTALSTGPSISAPTGVTAVATTTLGMGPYTSFSYGVTAVDSDTFEESVMSAAAGVQNVDISATAGSNLVTWSPVAGASYYNVYKAPPAYATAVPDGSLYGFIATTYGNQQVDSNIVADMSLVPPLHENPFARGQLLSVTIVTPGSGIIGPLTYTINSLTGSGATGFGVLVGGAMTDFVFTCGGENYMPGDTIEFGDGGGTPAVGWIQIAAGNVSNGDTLTLNGAVFTFVNDGTGWPNSTNNYKIEIGANSGGTAFFLDQALNTSATYLADVRLNVASYFSTDMGGGVWQESVNYKQNGTAGNAYTLAVSGVNLSESGANLTGGTGGTPPTGTLNVGVESGTYPSCVAYFQQRRAYANTANQPDTYWMSQPGAFTNFDARIPSVDSDAIVGTPWSVQVDGIQFMLPLIGSLIVLTGQAAYVVGGSGTSPTSPQPITPTSQQALPQAFNGCHFHVPPVVIDFDIYYVQAKGSIIRSLSYNFWVNVFTGVDVTELSSHLFLGYQINATAWCQEPWKVLWAVRDDGVLLSLTSVKSQEVMGWARHDTQGLFVGCTSVTETNAATDQPVDALYVVTQRFTPSGKSPFMIERMDSRLWSSVEDAWCVDCGLSLVPATRQATLTIGSGGATGAGVPLIVIDAPGSGYTANIVFEIKDPTGTGWTFSGVVRNAQGGITNINAAGGTGFTNPVVSWTDPGGKGGSGFECHVELINSVAITTDAPVFGVGDANSIIRCGRGVIAVTNYNSPTSLSGAVVSPILDVIPDDPNNTVLPFQPGDWTIGATTTTITGLNHLAGFQVTGLADGNVITPRTVTAGGTITLDQPASLVVAGLAFTAQLQSLYAEGGSPTVQGRRKQVAAVSARLEESGVVEVGTNQDNGSALSPRRIQVTWKALNPTNLSKLAPLPYGSSTTIQNDAFYTRPQPLYTGDVRVYPSSGFAKPGMVAVQQSQPKPCSVLAFIREEDVGDEPDSQPRQRGAGGGGR